MKQNEEEEEIKDEHITIKGTNQIIKDLVNKVYIFTLTNQNPLIKNKGNSICELGKSKTITNSSNAYMDNLKKKLRKKKRDNTTELAIDYKHIPSSEFLDTDLPINPYVFGLPIKSIEKTIKHLTSKLKIQADNITEKSSTPASKMKTKYFDKGGFPIKLNNLWQYTNYFSLCAEFSQNYIKYVFAIQKIYRQYILVSNGNHEITRSLSFKNQTSKNESHKEKFKKNLTIYGSKINKRRRPWSLIQMKQWYLLQ